MPSAYRIDRLKARPRHNPEELGIVPLIAAAAPAVLGTATKAVGGIVKGIGGLFKKKKKAPPPAPPTPSPAKAGSPAMPASHKASKVTATVKASKKKKSSGHSALAGVPTDVKADVLASLQQYQNASDSDKKTHAELVTKLAEVVKPAVDKMKSDVAQANLSRQVTSEHNALMKEQERWDANDRNHKAILDKISQLETALLGSNAQTKRVFKIYGIQT